MLWNGFRYHTEGSHSSLSQGSGMKSIIESDVKKGPPIESNHDVHEMKDMRNGRMKGIEW